MTRDVKVWRIIYCKILCNISVPYFIVSKKQFYIIFIKKKFNFFLSSFLIIYIFITFYN